SPQPDQGGGKGPRVRLRHGGDGPAPDPAPVGGPAVGLDRVSAESKEPPGDSRAEKTQDRLDKVGQPGGPVNALVCPPPPIKAGIRHADPHSGDGSLSGSHLASPISMHYLGPPPFRVLRSYASSRHQCKRLFARHRSPWMTRGRREPSAMAHAEGRTRLEAMEEGPQRHRSWDEELRLRGYRVTPAR